MYNRQLKIKSVVIVTIVMEKDNNAVNLGLGNYRTRKYSSAEVKRAT